MSVSFFRGNGAYIIIHLIFLLLLSVLFVAECFFLWNLFYREKGEVGSSEYYQYQYYQRSSQSSQRTFKESFGIISHSDDLLEGENVEFSFEKDLNNGNDILISRFGTMEYECKGSCYCEKDRRSGGGTVFSPFVRGISVLVASMSSILAFEYARKEFDHKCLEFSSTEEDDECKDGVIMSEIDECKPIIDDETDEDKVEDGKKKHYFCSGLCVPRNFDPEENEDVRLLLIIATYSENLQNQIDGLGERLQNYANGYNCERYSFETKIDLEQGLEDYKEEMEKMEMKHGLPIPGSVKFELSPEQYFMLSSLTEFCLGSSRFNLFQMVGTSKEQVLRDDPIIGDLIPSIMGDKKKYFGMTSLCFGHVSELDPSIRGISVPMNPSVRCRRTK